MDKATACAVTVAYENPTELAALLQSLEANRPDLILIVDNSSSAYVLAENERLAGAAGAIILRAGANSGSAGGFARGMSYAAERGYDWIWLLDQDGSAEPDCLTRLLAAADGADILCPAVISFEGRELADFRCRLNPLGAIVPTLSHGETKEIDLAGTHGIAIRRELIERVGVYDGERFFVGGEDFDYCLRARRAGGRIRLVGGARVYHPDLGGKARHSGVTMSLRRTGHALSPLLPQFLGFLKSGEGVGANARRTLMIRFNRERLKRWQLVLALVHSILVLAVIKLAGVECDFGETLKVYFGRGGRNG